MTAADVQPACPVCGGTTSVAMSAGVRMCLTGDCRNEWDPAGEPVAPAGSDAQAAADAVLGPPADELAARRAQQALDALVGTEVELEGGQRAVIMSFPDDDHVTVRLRDVDLADEWVTLGYNDVVRSVAKAVPVIDLPDPEAESLARTNMLIASLAIAAAMGSLTGDKGGYELGMAAGGWLPDDVDAMAVIEQGVAYAIASIVVVFDLPRDAVEAIANTYGLDAVQR